MVCNQKFFQDQIIRGMLSALVFFVFFYEETELILKWNIQLTLLYKRATIEQLYQINVQNTSLKQSLQILLIKCTICRWKTVHRKSVTSSLRVSHQFTLAKPLQSSECKQICSVFQHFCISAWFTPLLQLQTKINPSKSWAFQSRAKNYKLNPAITTFISLYCLFWAITVMFVTHDVLSTLRSKCHVSHGTWSINPAAPCPLLQYGKMSSEFRI